MIVNSTRLRGEYSRLAEVCRESGEPIYITHNGEDDTVLMSAGSFKSLTERMKLAASILEAEGSRLAGSKTYTIDEISEEMIKIIDAAI